MEVNTVISRHSTLTVLNDQEDPYLQKSLNMVQELKTQGKINPSPEKMTQVVNRPKDQKWLKIQMGIPMTNQMTLMVFYTPERFQWTILNDFPHGGVPFLSFLLNSMSASTGRFEILKILDNFTPRHWNTGLVSSGVSVITQTLETVNVDLELDYLQLSKTNLNNYT